MGISSKPLPLLSDTWRSSLAARELDDGGAGQARPGGARVKKLKSAAVGPIAMGACLAASISAWLRSA